MEDQYKHLFGEKDNRAELCVPGSVIDSLKESDFTMTGDFYDYEIDYAKRNFNVELSKYKKPRVILGLRDREVLSSTRERATSNVDGYELILELKND